MLSQLNIHIGNKINLALHNINKNFSWIFRQIKKENTNLLKDNVKEYLHDFRIDKDYLNWT